MKRNSFLLLGAAALVLLVSCEPERVVIESGAAGFDGYHVGYSWSGEARGTTLEEAGAFIETILKLDEDANILDATMRYWQRADGFWTTRQAGNAQVQVDFSVTPTAATLGSDYVAGDSMFSIHTVNVMSLWAVAVDSDGTVAATIVEPLTRYRFEFKFPADFNFGSRLDTLTIGSGRAVPVQRTAGGAFVAPGSWDELAGDHIFNLHYYSHVLTDMGPFAGMRGSTQVRALLEAMGVEFDGNGVPQPKAPAYGYFGIGGWAGNYNAIADYLIGQNARSLTSLVNWEVDRYRAGINDQNQFGVDTTSGATRTVQNSVDGIAGATVRMSRESTSYQRALVNAGILSEDDVIIGRF